MKSKGMIIGVAIVLMLVFWVIGGYNGLVKQQEAVETEWSQVENVYQRRADLIPNLVEVVKGYASHEKETFKAVTEARAQATSIKIDPTNMTEADLQKFQSAQDEIGRSLGRLLMVREQYPDLKANQNFLELQSQLEGTENRIAVARRDFNNVTKTYNTTLRSFPKNIIAAIFGFDKRPYFSAQEGTDKAPQIKF